MREIHAKNVSIIDLGRQGENLATQVIYDLSDWIAEYGDGTAELIHKRIGDSQPYPVAAVRDGNTLIWTVTSTDTAVATKPPIGYGKCELRWYSGDVLAKSKTWKTIVSPAMDTPSETAPPDHDQGWVDQVVEAGATAKASAESAKTDADRAETAAIKQPYPDAESGTWWIWDAVSGAYVDSGFSALPDTYTPTIDNTLTQSGKAADAAAVGDAISQLSGKIVQSVNNQKPDENGNVTVEVGSGGGDIALGITGATVGQIAKITAVDDAGKPTAWEPMDMASGGVNSDGWEKIGEVALESTIFIISAYVDGVLTVSSTEGVYPQTGQNTVLRKQDYSGYITGKLVATDVEGQYTMVNLDGATYAPSDDLTQYVIDVPKQGFIEFSSISEYQYFKARFTSPLLITHGVRQAISSNYYPLGFLNANYCGIAGGPVEIILETMPSPITDKIYSTACFKRKNPGGTAVFDTIQLFDRPSIPSTISFVHFNNLFIGGTKIELWGKA